MTTETTTVPTLTTVEDATAFLIKLAEGDNWVSVFWDKGWGDSPLRISIIVDGNGQEPKAYITADVYRALVGTRAVGKDSYGGHKKRRIHDYVALMPTERSGPDPGEVAEQVIRSILADMDGKPVKVEFFRGFKQGPFGPVGQYQTVKSGKVVGRHVLLLPGGADLAISAQEPDFLGYTIIGGGIADVVLYPRTADGDVDVAALIGEAFRVELVAAIEAKLAIVRAADERKATTR